MSLPNRSWALLTLACVCLHLLARRSSWPLAYVLHLSCLNLALELVVKRHSRNNVRQATRGATLDADTQIVVMCKRLQGFHSEHLFEYAFIGRQWLGVLPSLVAWQLALGSPAAAAALTAACYWAPFHLTCEYTHAGR